MTLKKAKSKQKTLSKKVTETVHEKQMNLLLEQVYGILDHQNNTWNPNNEELYSLLERVIFLKARENTFREFFDNMESVIEAASQLDFSKRAPISEVSLDKRNLFNYAVMCLNILVEKMGSSVVSMKAVNTMLSALPGTMIMVTDSKGVIRFINDTGEKLLGLKKNEYLGKSISLLLGDYEKINTEYSNGGITDRLVNLITPGKKKSQIPIYLTIPTPYTDHTEIEEIVYSLAVDNKLLQGGEKKFNIAQTFNNAIAPLNTIIDASHLLSEKVTDMDGKVLMSSIKSNAEKLKTEVSDTLHAIKTGSIQFSERTPINLAYFISEILKTLKLNENLDDIKFDVDIEHNNELYADPTLVYSLFQSVISIVVSQSYKRESFIQISAWDLNKSELLIRIHDNGIGMQTKDKEKLDGLSFNLMNDEKDINFYKVKETVKRLKGTVDVYSKHGRGCTFTIKIPCSKKEDNSKIKEGY